MVPVSASSPSLLVGTLEVELKDKRQDKPPLLPPPLFDKEDVPQDNANTKSDSEPKEVRKKSRKKSRKTRND